MKQQTNSPLYIMLRRLEKGDVQDTVEVDLATMELDLKDVPQGTMLTVEYHAYSIGEQKIVQGAIRGELPLSCDRCLDKWQFPLNLQYRHVYVPGLAEDGNSEPDDGDFFFNADGNGFSIAPGIREEILVVLPMKQVPPEAEDGTCTWCDRSPQEVLGEIARPDPDPRFAVLKQLLNKSDNDES